MQLRLPWDLVRRERDRYLVVGGLQLPVVIVRHRRARRYVVRVMADGVRVTVPRGASIAGGLAFATRQSSWIEREWRRQRERAAPWQDGTSLWFRGERIALSVAGAVIELAAESIKIQADADVRTAVEAWLRSVAESELPSRCYDCSRELGLAPTRVAVRNHRSRWGACSATGVISLNWRLVQMPVEVRDYVIIHELMHLKQPNHSRAFWREVESACSSWRESERWLRRFGREIF